MKPPIHSTTRNQQIDQQDGTRKTLPYGDPLLSTGVKTKNVVHLIFFFFSRQTPDDVWRITEKKRNELKPISRTMDTRRSGCKTYSLRKIIIHHLSYCVIAWLIYGRGTAEARVLLEAGSRGHFRRYSKRHLLHLDRRVAREREREREKILDDCCLLLYLRRSCSNSLSLSLSSFLFSTLTL